MADTTDIIKALKWWNADRFKSLQRKLTAAKSTIQKEALSANFKRQRQTLLAKAFPKSEAAEDARPMLVWILALSLHRERISRGYFYERKYIASDIERDFDRKNATTVLASAVRGWREITEFLEENTGTMTRHPIRRGSRSSKRTIVNPVKKCLLIRAQSPCWSGLIPKWRLLNLNPYIGYRTSIQ